MKKLFYFPLLVLLLFSACEYEPGVSESFSRYRHRDGITSVTVPGWLIGLASRMGDLEKEERALLRNINKVNVLTVDDQDLNKTLNFHEEFYLIVARNPEMEELLKVDRGNEQITIFGTGNEKVFNELVILVGGNDNAIVHIKGRIKAEMLSDLINKEADYGLMSWNN